MVAMLAQSLFQTFGAIDCTPKTFFGLIPWYQYLDVQAVNIKDHSGRVISSLCQVQGFNDSTTALGNHSPLLLVGLAILDDLLRVAAMVAVGYIIYGGIQYMSSQGAPDSTKKAQQTIINALVGVGIAIMAASIVAFIGNRLGS